MKCRNCGAELNNGRCEYCGAVFAEDMRIFHLKQPTLDASEFEKIIRQIRETACKPDDSVMHKIRVKDVIEVTCIGDTERHFIEGI